MRCSIRICGCHAHRLPAPVSGETPTCASDIGSRGEMIGLSCPTVIVVFFQCEIKRGHPDAQQIVVRRQRSGEKIHI